MEPFVFPVLVSATVAGPVAQDRNHKVIITSLRPLTPHSQLAGQSCWFYDLNVLGIWPLLSTAHSSFCRNPVMALVLSASFPHHASPLLPHFSACDLDDIISLLTSQEESLLQTAWRVGSSSWYSNYHSMVHKDQHGSPWWDTDKYRVITEKSL